MQKAPKTSEVLLAIEGLQKSFGTQPVLNGVSLHMTRGERVAIMGPSGSGKSTLLSCLAGLDEPDAGEIVFQGQDLCGMGSAEKAALRRASITSIFQFFHLLPTLRAYENVEFPLLLRGDRKEERRKRVQSLLDEIGLRERAMAWPAELSGGELQRLAIARAMVTEPALILADEPTGSLDSKNSRKVLALLSQLTVAHHTALIMVTHDREAATMCDTLYAMHDGSLAPFHDDEH